jgi:hypothetical protein
MATFIVVSVGNKSVEELEFHRIFGVNCGTIIRSLDNVPRVVIWNVNDLRTLTEQLGILESAGIVAAQAKDFAGVAFLIEKYMP